MVSLPPASVAGRKVGVADGQAGRPVDELAATLAGATCAPFLAQALHLPGLAALASLLTLTAAALALLTMPHTPADR